MTIIPYEHPTFERQSAMLSTLLKLIEHVTNNHLCKASNCGEDYFPIELKPDGSAHGALFLPYKLKGEDKERYDAIVSKIIGNMYLPKWSVAKGFNFKEEVIEKIKKCFAQNQVATLWAPSSGVTTSTVKVE